jgi:hypothetical protein
LQPQKAPFSLAKRHASFFAKQRPRPVPTRKEKWKDHISDDGGQIVRTGTPRNFTMSKSRRGFIRTLIKRTRWEFPSLFQAFEKMYLHERFRAVGEPMVNGVEECE